MSKKTLLLSAIVALFSGSGIANTQPFSPQLTPISLANIGEIRQFDVADTGDLALINQQGELFHFNGKNAEKLGQDYSPDISPSFAYSRIAAADKQGNFTLWTPTQRYRSAIPIAPNTHFVALRFATIAVVQQHGKTHLARLETAREKVKISAIRDDIEILPDARPIQINLTGNNPEQGHIAVLAQPDSTTYRHGVLGDDIEAKALYYLERHSLENLADPLMLNTGVFEANTLATLTAKSPQTQEIQHLAVTVISGDQGGARTAVIGEQQGKFTILAKSDPLPSHRWQSPFTYQSKLYAIQMPHLSRRLVEYQIQGNKLAENEILTGVSNHKIGDHETNLVASAREFSILPQTDYHHVTLWDHRIDQFIPINTRLPARIIKTKATEEYIYLLLENGQLWTVTVQP